jgi:hypothetical protein
LPAQRNGTKSIYVPTLKFDWRRVPQTSAIAKKWLPPPRAR